MKFCKTHLYPEFSATKVRFATWPDSFHCTRTHHLSGWPRSTERQYQFPQELPGISDFISSGSCNSEAQIIVRVTVWIHNSGSVPERCAPAAPIFVSPRCRLWHPPVFLLRGRTTGPSIWLYRLSQTWGSRNALPYCLPSLCFPLESVGAE